MLGRMANYSFPTTALAVLHRAHALVLAFRDGVRTVMREVARLYQSLVVGLYSFKRWRGPRPAYFLVAGGKLSPKAFRTIEAYVRTHWPQSLRHYRGLA